MRDREATSRGLIYQNFALQNPAKTSHETQNVEKTRENFRKNKNIIVQVGENGAECKFGSGGQARKRGSKGKAMENVVLRHTSLVLLLLPRQRPVLSILYGC
jgi:hypothetical protein